MKGRCEGACHTESEGTHQSTLLTICIIKNLIQVTYNTILSPLDSFEHRPDLNSNPTDDRLVLKMDHQELDPAVPPSLVHSGESGASSDRPLTPSTACE